MSGLEIAGVVLGAFSVAIEALDKYHEVSRMLDFWWKIRLDHQKCRREIKFEQLIFERTLRRTLLPMVSNRDQIDQFLAEPGGVLWRDPRIEAQLRYRLQESYDLYLEVIRELQRNLHDINKEMAFDKEGIQKRLYEQKVGMLQIWVCTETNILENQKASKDTNMKAILLKSSSKENREYQLYRAQFAIGKTKRDELFAELKANNERLEKLLGSSDDMRDIEAKFKQVPDFLNPKMKITVSNFWRHADHLYNVLSKAWSCRCASQHQANIQLQHETLTDSEFFMLFLGNEDLKNAKENTWKARETKILMSDPLAGSVPVRRPTGNTGIVIAQSQKAANTAPSPPKTQTQTSTTQYHTQKGTIATKNMIKDLCATFSIRRSAEDGYGFLEDTHKRYHIYPTSDEPFTLGFEEPISLKDMLQEKYRPRLTRRQRYRLALAISSSFVQLWDSAWLDAPAFNPMDVFFLRDPEHSNKIVLDRPYLSRKFIGKAPVRLPAANESSSPGISFIGVLLLELCWGILIEESPNRQRYPFVDPKLNHIYDQLVAVELLKDVVDEAGVDYSEAATWCLLGSKSVGSGDDWRQIFFERVVQPLERSYSYLLPNKHSTSGVII